MERLRIFISSPSDVRPERLIAESVVRRLDREFAHYFRLEPVLWEREPLLASHHFQDSRNIPRPAATDIVLVILWSRLGMTLPSPDYAGAISGRTPVTGTEWEFEDALAASKDRGRPDLLVYRKDAKVLASLDDDAALEDQRAQRRALEGFVSRWFLNADSKSVLAAFHMFTDSTGFEEQIALHLRSLLVRRLEASGKAESGPVSIRWHQGSPFRGLESFEPEHAPIFFGRTRARNDLRDLLARRNATGNGFVLIVGNSGIGKSSLVKAGLVPHLSLPGMVERVALCRHAIFRPSDPPKPGDPIAALTAAIFRALPELTTLRYRLDQLEAQVSRDPEGLPFIIEQGLNKASQAAELTEIGRSRLLLVVDQLEELFTDQRILNPVRREFAQILEILAKAGSVWLLATLRADFYDQMQEVPELLHLSRDGTYLLEPPQGAEIAQIITLPAREAGLRFEHSDVGISLDEVIREDAAAGIGNLPLLEYCLGQLWQRRSEDGLLQFSAYKAMGGLTGAIARQAEQVVAAAAPDVRAALPGLLRVLVTVGPEADGRPSARPVPLARLPEPDPRRILAEAMLHPSARLLVAAATADGPPVLRLAHEALLTHWPEAVRLVQENREDLALRTRLEHEALLWRTAELDDKLSLLLRPGKPLTDAKDLLARRREDLEPEVAAFILASTVAEQQERERQRLDRQRQLRWTRATAAALLLLLLIAAGFGGWAWNSNRTAQLALVRVFMQQAFTEMDNRNFPRAARLGLAARQIAGDDMAQVAGIQDLLAMLLHNSGESLPLVGHTGEVNSAVFSSDGHRVVTASSDQTAIVWDAETGRALHVLPSHEDKVSNAIFSPDGKHIVTVSDDNTARIWNAETGEEIAILRHDGAVNSAAFSPDSTRIVLGSADKAASVWTVTGSMIADFRQHQDEVKSAVFNLDGKRAVTASLDGTAQVWDAATGQQIAVLGDHENEITRAVFSPDGKKVVTVCVDGTVREWNAVTGKPGMVFSGHEGEVNSAVYSLTGMHMLTSSSDGTAREWNTSSGHQDSVMRGHEDVVTSVVYSPVLGAATASRDHTARIWDEYGREFAVLSGHENAVNSVAFNPNGDHLVTASDDHTARIWEVPFENTFLLFPDDVEVPDGTIHSPDGKRKLVISDDETARLLESATGREIAVLCRLPHGESSADFSWDGALVVTACEDGMARLWDPASGREVASPMAHHGWARSVAFSQDASRILITLNSEATLWDTATGRITATFHDYHSGIAAAAINMDATRVVTASQDNTVQLWDAATGREIAHLSSIFHGVDRIELDKDGTSIKAISGSRRISFLDIPRLNQPMGDMVRDTCTRILVPYHGSRSFARQELHNHRTLQEILDERGIAGQDLCADVPNIPSMLQ